MRKHDADVAGTNMRIDIDARMMTAREYGVDGAVPKLFWAATLGNRPAKRRKGRHDESESDESDDKAGASDGVTTEKEDAGDHTVFGGEKKIVSGGEGGEKKLRAREK
ncbi:unnamed protein product [Linum trigynum]|uniref:Uncharacterized protein n=1 Tax=Linum trigynum TaxID=586398 RepID=A0AAV2D7Q2_9ROSI